MKITGTQPEIQSDVSKRPGFVEVSANPVAFGASVGAAQSRLGQGLEEGANHLFHAFTLSQGLLNETMAKEADVAASSELTNLQYDPKTGYMGKKGKAAVESYQSTLEATNDIRKRHLDALPNDQAKKMFDQSFLRRLQYGQEGIGSHASRENLQWMNDTSKARIANLSAEGSLNWNNLSRFNSVIIPAIASETVSQAEMHGYGPDDPVTVAELRKNIDAAHISRLKAMVPYDPKGAIDQLGEVNKQLSGAGRVQAEEVIMHGIRIAHEEEQWAEHRRTVQRRENDEKLAQGFFSKFQQGQLTPRMIDQSDMTFPLKAHFYSMVEAQSRRETKLDQDNPETVQKLLSRVMLPWGNKDKLTDIGEVFASVGNGTSLSKAGVIAKLVIDARSEDGQRLAETRARVFANLRPQFVRDTATGPDVQGGRDFLEFASAAIAREAQLAHGPNKEDPQSLYRVDKSGRMPIDDMVNTYKATFRQRLDRQIQGIRDISGGHGDVKTVSSMPKKDGESPGEFLLRWRRANP